MKLTQHEIHLIILALADRGDKFAETNEGKASEYYVLEEKFRRERNNKK